MSLTAFRNIRAKIEFYRKELATIKQRKEEFEAEMVEKGPNMEMVGTFMGLNDMKEQLYSSLVKEYEELVAVLESLAQIPNDDRLPATS